MDKNISLRITKERINNEWSQRELAEKCGWINGGSRISNYEQGTREPTLADLNKIADALKVSSEYIIFGKLSNVGQLESIDQRIPVLNWKDIGAPCNDIINLVHKETEMLPNIFNTGRNSYALTIQDDSMNPNPGVEHSFIKGDKIIIEPDLKHKTGDFVIARLKASNEAFFKQYFYEDGKHYLTSLNPKLNRSMELNDDIEIIGVYIGMIRKHRK